MFWLGEVVVDGVIEALVVRLARRAILNVACATYIAGERRVRLAAPGAN